MPRLKFHVLIVTVFSLLLSFCQSCQFLQVCIYLRPLFGHDFSVPITFLCYIVNGILNIIREVFYIYIFRVDCVLPSIGVCMERSQMTSNSFLTLFFPLPPFCQPVLTSITPQLTSTLTRQPLPQSKNICIELPKS